MIPYLKDYTGNLKWLPERTLYLTKYGSHAYGTSTPTSDLDVRGICVPPAEYFLGFSKNFEQLVTNTPVDLVVYGIVKFFKLASECNPSVIEILYTNESDILYLNNRILPLIENRDEFLSRRVKHTFSGYAMSQLKRIKTHRRWLLNPPTHKPTRAEYGLKDAPLLPKEQTEAALAVISKELDTWEPDLDGVDPATRIAVLGHFESTLTKMKLGAEEQWWAAGRTVGLDENFLKVMSEERAFKNAVSNWTQYQNWKETRNPERAAMEAKWGLDLKHAMHLVRLMRMATEILESKQVLVRRPDAEELLAIRNGAWSYDQLIEWAEEMEKKLDIIESTSPLPKKVNLEKLDKLCMDIVHSML